MVLLTGYRKSDYLLQRLYQQLIQEASNFFCLKHCNCMKSFFFCISSTNSETLRWLNFFFKATLEDFKSVPIVSTIFSARRLSKMLATILFCLPCKLRVFYNRIEFFNLYFIWSLFYFGL